jgi:hypothetical protein
MHRIPILVTLTCLLALAAPAGAEDLTETIGVARPGRLRIELDRGSVEVLTHSEPTVHVRAEARGLGASSVEFEVVRDGDDVVLRARTEEWLDWLSSGPRLRVVVFVPPSFEVVSSSQHALITRRGPVELSVPTRAAGKHAR